MGRWKEVDYTEHQRDILTGLNVAASACSVSGALFIVGNYYLFPELRTFAFKLVLFVAIGDIINGIGNFIGSPSHNSHAACFIQGLIIQLGDMISFGWVSAIAWIVFTVLRRDSPITQIDTDRWFFRMNFVIWSLAILFSLVPIPNYGAAGGLCWINIHTNFGKEIRWICFYVPLWTVIIFMMYVYCKVWSKLTIIRRGSKDNGSLPQGVATGKVATNDDPKQTELQIQTGNMDGQTIPPVQPSESDIMGNTQIHQRQTSDEETGYIEPKFSDLIVGNTNGPTNAQLGVGVTTTTNNNVNSNANITTNKVDASGNSTVPTNNTATNANSLRKPSQDHGHSGGLLPRIQFYPIILFCCYLSATIRELYQLFSGKDAPFALAALDIFTAALLGTCNAIAYGATPSVREKDKALIGQLCSNLNMKCRNLCNRNNDVNSNKTEPDLR